MTKYLMLLLTACIVGCSSAPKVPVDTPLNLAPSLLEECPKLEKLSETATFNEVLDVSRTNLKLYAKCANLQHNSVEFIKKVAGEK